MPAISRDQDEILVKYLILSENKEINVQITFGLSICE